jgi:hypothetical protein
MLAFLIPVILLAGATFGGAALEMSSKSTTAAPTAPTNQTAPARTMPAQGVLPFDPAYRQR